tara:strand:+ start:1649 stop:2458 length:810 start_codon:yes stop_codon:yes gene_type:complete
MIIFKSINKLNKEVNFKANIGFVPTMGAIHKGHESLIHRSKKKCKKTLVSIFINPAQFNKKNDFNRYPRKLANDIKILKRLKVDYLLLPEFKEIYKNKKNMKISLNKKDKILCAKYRPGHFEGVLAVINQFLINIKPKYMFLGDKDYQQVLLIKNFIKKKFSTKIITCKTIRLKNLIPFSSRNLLLSNNNLKKSMLISANLKKLHFLIKKNFEYTYKIEKIKKNISKLGVKLEYLELRNKNNLSRKFNKSNFKIFIAYYLQNVRLIDNF